MIKNSKISVQLLEKVGAPLMAAINSVSLEDETVQAESAQVIAKLLGQSVQMGTMLYSSLQIEEDVDQADSTRLALTGLATPLIADFYKQKKQPPSDDDIKRMVQSLEGILSFGENFSPAAEAQSRLQTIEHDSVLFDKSQPTLVMLQAMAPVITAVEEFSFGQAQKKLIQDIAAKLEVRATQIASAQGLTDKLQELVIFKSLATLYAACYKNEVVRVSSGGDEARGELSVDPIWKSFEVSASMVEALMGFEAGEVAVQSDVQPVPQEAPPVPAPVTEAAPVAPPNTPATPPVEKAAAAGGPMGFFTKPKEGGEAAPAPAQAEATAPAPVSEAAPVTQQAVPATTSEPESAPSEEAPSSPMGFFKPGAKKKEGDDCLLYTSPSPRDRG